MQLGIRCLPVSGWVPSALSRLVLPLAAAVCSVIPAARASDWPQWMGPLRDGHWEEEGIAARAHPEKAVLKWTAKAGGGYAGPAVAQGRAYLMSFYRDGTQGDTSQGLKGDEQLLCVDAATGRVLWEQRWRASYLIDYASGPRATPTVQDGLVHALGAEGHLLCADAATGEVKWRRELQKDLPCKSPTWGFAGHPLVYRDLLICIGGGDGSTCVAFDRRTGEEKWRALSSKQAGYCPPVLIHHAGEPQLIVWHGEAINALNPDTGKVFWTIPRATLHGVSMASPLLRGDDLYISAYWWGSRMLRLKPDKSLPDTLWETEREGDTRTEHLNSLMGSPLTVEGHLYGICSQGQLRCLEWDTGERKWETMEATGGKKDKWVTAFLTRLGRSGNEFLIFNEQGELIRATLTPEKWTGHSRRVLIEPNSPDMKSRKIVWSHPAYSNGRVFVRNDGELRCWEFAE